MHLNLKQASQADGKTVKDPGISVYTAVSIRDSDYHNLDDAPLTELPRISSK